MASTADNKLSISTFSISHICKSDVYTGKMNNVRKKVPLHAIFSSTEYRESVHTKDLSSMSEVWDGTWLGLKISLVCNISTELRISCNQKVANSFSTEVETRTTGLGI